MSFEPPADSVVPGVWLPEEYAALSLSGYKLVSLLGQGGMGQVFLAKQEKLDRYVAVKMLSASADCSADAMRRLYSEARTLANLSHPNIVGCHDILRDGERLFVIMDFVPGGLNVLGLSVKYGQIPEQRAAGIVLQAARGLSYCHSKGFIHRDIKPANLLVFHDEAELPDSIDELLDREHCRIMIADFGLAKSTLQGEAAATHQGGLVIGTPAYMAREQAEGKEVDHRADIFGLGATFFRLFTGHDPIEADSSGQALRLRLTTELPDVGKYGVQLSTLGAKTLARMTASPPEQRYQDYRELIADLETLASGPGALRKRQRSLPFSRRRMGIVAAALLLLGGLAMLLAHRAADQDLSRSLDNWSGGANGWLVAAPDDAREGELGLVCDSPGERVTLDRVVPTGSDIAFAMRLPGNGQAEVQLLTNGDPLWTLRWTRTGEECQLQAGSTGQVSDIPMKAAKPPAEWYAVRLRTGPRQVVLYLDEHLASYSQFESPVQDVTLAFELTQGQLLQVKDVRIVPSARTSRP